MNPASTLYASVARARRRWYARHPEARRRLRRPVISVGNVAVGGSGKTPLVAHLARLLLEMGQRPAILSRGYARRVSQPGVTVVSDGQRLLSDLDRAGDEPLMLARALPTVPVLVSTERYLAGCVAERQLGCTVHLLDDGFQHFGLERRADLVIVRHEDVASRLTLPAGRLREPLDVLDAADALIVDEEATGAAVASYRRPGVPTFSIRQEAGPARFVDPEGRVAMPAPGTKVLAVSGIARPERFAATLEGLGWVVVGQLAFRDHHRYDKDDVTRVRAAMDAAHAVMVLTTEKDLVRLLPLQPLPMPVAWVPLKVEVGPADGFRDWLGAQVEANHE